MCQSGCYFSVLSALRYKSEELSHPPNWIVGSIKSIGNSNSQAGKPVHDFECAVSSSGMAGRRRDLRTQILKPHLMATSESSIVVLDRGSPTSQYFIAIPHLFELVDSTKSGSSLLLSVDIDKSLSPLAGSTSVSLH